MGGKSNLAFELSVVFQTDIFMYTQTSIYMHRCTHSYGFITLGKVEKYTDIKEGGTSGKIFKNFV